MKKSILMETKPLDQEWRSLLLEAKKQGISLVEIQAFLRRASVRKDA